MWVQFPILRSTKIAIVQTKNQGLINQYPELTPLKIVEKISTLMTLILGTNPWAWNSQNQRKMKKLKFLKVRTMIPLRGSAKRWRSIFLDEKSLALIGVRMTVRLMISDFLNVVCLSNSSRSMELGRGRSSHSCLFMSKAIRTVYYH